MQTLQKEPDSDPKRESDPTIATLQNSLQKLQEDSDYKQEKILALQRVNNNLETARNKFIQLHEEEKNERKELMVKVERYARKYNLLLGICIALLVVLIIQYLSTIPGLLG